MWPAGAGSATYAALRSQEHRGHSDTHTHRLLRQHHCSRKVGQPMGKAGLVSSIRRSTTMDDAFRSWTPSRPSRPPPVSPSAPTVSVDGHGFASLIAGLIRRGFFLGDTYSVLLQCMGGVCVIAERNRSVDPTGVSFRGQESITPCGGINSPRC